MVLDDSSYLTKEEIIKQHGKKVFEDFEKFMFGQTVLVLDDGSCGFYIWDFEKFFRQYSPGK